MESKSWLLLLYSLPTRNTAERVSLWRKLKKHGAIQLKTSAYVLPNATVHYERFQWLAKQVRDDGGEATLIHATKIEGLSNEQIVQMFNGARAKDYDELIAGLNELLKRNKEKRGEDFAAELEKLNRRFKEIQDIDYFGCPAAHDAEVRLQRAANSHLPGPKGRSILAKEDFAARTWLTRPRPEIDRVASAWLIRNFIDPQAVFVFAPSAAAFPKAIPFDMTDAEFTHHGDDCTFETLLKRFGLADKALQKIGEMVHDADLEDEKFGRPECIGIDQVLKGWAKSGLTDQQLLDQGGKCFDALYRQLKK
ncbi:MAG TPA: chromate resistance protein ChrB domain-containing protein [Verrucomicrobiae bacterium]